MRIKSRSKQYRARKLHEALKKGKPAAKPRAAPAAKAEPRYTPVYPERHRLQSRRSVQRAPKTRPSLVPGAVLILLAGKHAGKRVVLLKVRASPVFAEVLRVLTLLSPRFWRVVCCW